MYKLKNINHTFDVVSGDVGCTIRKGGKWSNLNVGASLKLINCPKAHFGECYKECKFEGYGKITGWWVGKLKKLPPSLLAIEHNIAARDITVLKDMLQVAYGDINDEDIVTALLYERINTGVE